MNQVEKNTAQTALFLGSRADGGVLGQAFKISEHTFFMMKGIDIVGQRLNAIFDKIGTGAGSVSNDTYNFYIDGASSTAAADVQVLAQQIVKQVKTSGFRGRRV
jgi:hypothetical protein